MKAKLFVSLAIFSLLPLLLPASGDAAGATRVAAAIWAHGELYDTIGTPTAFRDPPEHSTDALYNFGMSGLDGQRAVSVAAPGDPDYNGGRWSVVRVTFTDQGMAVHDADGDGVVDFELTSAAEVLDHVALGHLELMETSIYFECPLLPRRTR
jgi:hypothetical protein